MFVRAHGGMKTDGDWWEQHVYSFDVESITKTDSFVHRIRGDILRQNTSFTVRVSQQEDEEILFY